MVNRREHDYLTSGREASEFGPTSPPRTEPIYELWRDSAISELIAAKEITEFESYLSWREFASELICLAVTGSLRINVRPANNILLGSGTVAERALAAAGPLSSDFPKLSTH